MVVWSRGGRRSVRDAGVFSEEVIDWLLVRVRVVVEAMDAVELPSPAAKLVAEDRFGNPGSGDGPSLHDGGSADGFHCIDISFDCGSLRNDTRCPTASSKLNSTSRTKSDGPNNVFVSSKDEKGGKRKYPGEKRFSVLLSSTHECQQTLKKSTKRSVCSPSSRRPRTDKSWAFRQKNAIDGKRCDQKNYRVVGKSKFDPFVSKNSSAGSDSSCGKNILGIYGLKTDFHNVTKVVDDPSLTELLDDSYKFPSLLQDKGKRGQNVNDSILPLAKKAYSLLPFRNSTNSPGKNIPICPLNLSSSSSCANDCVGETKHVGEMLPTYEAREFQRKSQLYLPKDILKKLKLPVPPDLDSLLHDTNMFSSTPLCAVNGSENVTNASLPPFSWSLSHSGATKPISDAGKCIANRNTCQSKWIRIESITGSNVDGNLFAELDPKVHVHPRDPSKQPKLNNLLEDVKNMVMDFSLPCCRIPDEPHVLADTTDSHSVDDLISSMGFDCLSLNDSSDPSPLSGGKISSGNYHMGDCKGFKDEKKEAESNTQHHEDGLFSPSSLSNSGLCETTVHNMKKSAGVSHRCLKTGSYKKKLDGWKQLPTRKCEKPGHCPQLVAAAEVLYEMAKCTDFPRKSLPSSFSQTPCASSSRKIRWQDTSPRITLKSSKSRPPPGNTERFFTEASSSGAMRTSSQKSSKHFPMKSNKKTKFSCTDNVGKGHIRWNAASLEAAIPVKRFFKKPATEVNSSLLPTIIEKGSEFHQNFKKRTFPSSLYANTGACVKDLSRGKSRRM